MHSSGPHSGTVTPILSANLQAVSGLVHGFSTRTGGVSTAYRMHPGNDGDLNLGYTEHDSSENVCHNRERWLRALNIARGSFRFALPRQEHGAAILVIRDAAEAAAELALPGTARGDGLLTDQPGVLLTIQTADCIPVLLCDPVKHVVGAFHAGWRGTLARIVEHGVDAMRQNYGTDTKDIVAAIGPGIGPRSFTVGDDVQRQFVAVFAYSQQLFHTVDGTAGVRMDLSEANRRQLLHCGVLENNVDTIGEDTAADTSRFFSYRAEQGRTGRMMSSIGWCN